MSKHLIRCTLDELIEIFNDDIKKFTTHVFTTTSQFQSLNKLKENLERNQVYVVNGFSQNYNCKCSREIAGAYFGASKKQVSLHTGGFYYKNDDNQLTFESFAVLSDDLTHDATRPLCGHYSNLF